MMLLAFFAVVTMWHSRCQCEMLQNRPSGSKVVMAMAFESVFEMMFVGIDCIFDNSSQSISTWDALES